MLLQGSIAFARVFKNRSANVGIDKFENRFPDHKGSVKIPLIGGITVNNIGNI